MTEEMQEKIKDAFSKSDRKVKDLFWLKAIIPPMYDDTDKFHSAFTLGKQVQRETSEWVERRQKMIDEGVIK